MPNLIAWIEIFISMPNLIAWIEAQLKRGKKEELKDYLARTGYSQKAVSHKEKVKISNNFDMFLLMGCKLC